MKAGKSTAKKLIKIVIKDIDAKKVLMELPPTKASETKARRMSVMCGIEVIRVYGD